jgi:anti-sigma B factor antagonist
MLKSETSGEIIICSFDQSNKLNAMNSESVKAEAGNFFETAHARLILDMENIVFIDSSGFGALLSILKKARKNDGIFKICSLSPEVKALFKLLQLHTVFEIFENREECLKSYS